LSRVFVAGEALRREKRDRPDGEAKSLDGNSATKMDFDGTLGLTAGYDLPESGAADYLPKRGAVRKNGLLLAENKVNCPPAREPMARKI